MSHDRDQQKLMACILNNGKKILVLAAYLFLVSLIDIEDKESGAFINLYTDLATDDLKKALTKSGEGALHFVRRQEARHLDNIKRKGCALHLIVPSF